MSIKLEHEALLNEVHRTVMDLSGRRQYDVDGITKALIRKGIETVDQFDDMRDPDSFWFIVSDHDITA